MALRIVGDAAYSVFGRHAGGHRWQRSPPNERRDRVHTSTITVAVLNETKAANVSVSDADLSWSFCRGSGPGGQNKNKVNSAVILKHIPTGISVRCEAERSQHSNKQTAMSWLKAKLLEQQESRLSAQENAARRQQIGAGYRGDKVFTIRVRDNVVIDHVNDRKLSYDRYIKGEI